MRSKFYLISTLVFILFYLKTVAQNIIFDLPIVGDTIDYEEKVKFVLFEEIPNSDYYFSIITEKNTDTIITHYKKSDTLEQKVTLKYVSSILNNITKLNTYYNTIGKDPTNSQNNYSFISNPTPLTEYEFEKKRSDSLLSTDPSAYKEIIKARKKAEKHNPNRKKWYDKDPGRIETDKNLPSYKDQQIRHIPMPTYTSPKWTPR